MADAISSLSVIANDSTLKNNVDTIDGDEHNTHRTNYRTEINLHKTVLEQQESNYAGLTVTNKPEGKIICDNTVVPAVMKYYEDDSGTEQELAGTTLTQTLTNKTIAEYVWGTSAQVTAGTATMYTEASGTPKDSAGSTITFSIGDRIAIVYNSTLTANLVLDGGSVERLNVFMDQGVTLAMGADSGNSNVPYKIQFKNADKLKADIHTDKDYEEVLSVKPTASRTEMSVVSNQTNNSIIHLNNRQIFGRRRVEYKSVKTKDPYSIMFDGTNDLSQDEYKDLFDEFGYNFTSAIATALSNSTFQIPDTRGRFVRIGNGDYTSISPDQHERVATVTFTQWPNTATNISVDLTSGSNEIEVDATAAGTQADNLKFLQGMVGMRVQTSGNSLPDETAGTPATSIIDSVDISTPSAVILTIVDSRTGSDANATATATETLTISNSGDVGASTEQDQFQGHRHIKEAANTGVVSSGTGRAAITDISVGTLSNLYTDYAVTDPTHGVGRIGSETRSINSLKFEYYLL